MHKRVSKFSARTEICNVIPSRNKKAKSLLTKNLAFVFPWVEGGARTHDIQNHNLTL